MKNRDQMTRTCMSCGLPKPLSAFLQITAQGTVYGSICAACRSKGAREKVKKSLLEEEQSSTTAGARIGTKQKVDIEREKARLLREAKELEIKEAQKREELAREKQDRSDQREQTEKAHRAEVEEKKRRQLASQKKVGTSQTVIGQKMVNDRAGVAYQNEKQQALDAKKTDDEIKQHVRANTVDVTGNVQHNVVAVDNPTFRSFLSWLGGDAPLVKAMDRMFKKTPSATQVAAPSEKPVTGGKPVAGVALAKQVPQEKAPLEKPTFSTASAKQTTFSVKQSQEKKSDEPKQDAAKNFIRKNWSK